MTLTGYSLPQQLADAQHQNRHLLDELQSAHLLIHALVMQQGGSVLVLPEMLDSAKRGALRSTPEGMGFRLEALPDAGGETG